jgi:hypothetical protein
MEFKFPVSKRSLREWFVKARFGWTVRADSDDYRCLHEAGHAQAAILVGARVPMLEMDGTVEGAAARARIDWEPVWPPTQDQRRLVACAGHAIEHLLFEAGRIRNPLGKSFSANEFAAYALSNAVQDMTRFFRGVDIGDWSSSMQQEFAAYSKAIAQPTLSSRLRRVVELARLLQTRATLSHRDIESVLASNKRATS